MTTSSTPALAMDDLLLAFDLAPVGLCVARQRIIQRCNQSFANMFLWDANALEGQSLVELYPSAQEFEHIGRMGLSELRDSGTYGDERIMRRHDGTLFWCHVMGRSLDRRDPFACAVWSFEDLSARRPMGVVLTPREREIAQQLVTGRTSKEIGRSLGISPRTVEAHRARLMAKLDVHTTGEMISRLVGVC